MSGEVSLMNASGGSSDGEYTDTIETNDSLSGVGMCLLMEPVRSLAFHIVIFRISIS
jgi:hypothetical protein